MQNNLISYYGTINRSLIDSSSFKQRIMNELDTLFDQFGFDNQQVTMVLKNIVPRLEESIDSTSKRDASALVDIDMLEILSQTKIDKNIQQALLIDQKILLAKEKGKIIDEKIEITKEEAETILKEVDLLKAEVTNIQLKINNINKKIESLELQQLNEQSMKRMKEDKVLLMKQENINLLAKSKVLQQEKVLIERDNERMQVQEVTNGQKLLYMKKETEIVGQQTGLFMNQREGYGDNAIVKAAEFQGGMASFAVNVDSTSAGEAISKFTTSINELITRANR